MNLKSFSLLTALSLVLSSLVDAHGQMTKPAARPISQKYRANCGALSGAGDQELQYAPVELLNSRAQSDRPAAATFNMMNGCRGTVYETRNTVTALVAGSLFDVEWVIQAPHPGIMVLSIVKPSTDSSGTITYHSVLKLLTIDPFAERSNDKTSTMAEIPTSFTECKAPGECALQFYWHADLAGQTCPTCADIVVAGSGEPRGQTTAPVELTATPATISPEVPTIVTHKCRFRPRSL